MKIIKRVTYLNKLIAFKDKQLMKAPCPPCLCKRTIDYRTHDISVF